jgi:hypothetical protein
VIGREFDADVHLVWDPDDPLAPVKEAVKECADADLVPGKVAAAVEAMARFGMDHPTRITVRAYLKNEGLLGFREFDKLIKSATPAKSAHRRTPPLAGKEDILAAAVETTGELGVTGEARIVRGTYLTAVSQVLGEPLSLVVKGSSAGGKSFSTRNTLPDRPPLPQWIARLSERGREPYRRPGSHLLLTDAQWASYDALQELRARQRARGLDGAGVGGGLAVMIRSRVLL